jgi:hypothetical protein
LFYYPPKTDFDTQTKNVGLSVAIINLLIFRFYKISRSGILTWKCSIKILTFY